jgi:hypothetical protein
LGVPPLRHARGRPSGARFVGSTFKNGIRVYDN